MNADIFTNFICLHFNFCIDIGEFPQAFKHAEIIPVHNKKKKVTKLITDLSAYCQTFLKFIKKRIYYQLYGYFDKILYRINVDSAKDIVLRIAC